MKAFSLKNVGKRFFITYQRENPNRTFFQPFPRHKIASEFWALKGINMEAERGRAIGVIGRNGAGKTTLLNVLAGITTPTIGKVEINGKVSSMLTLGAGFQEELTGKENIYLNSSILAMGRSELNKKYRNIVEFSELDGFLESPLKTYSQGMRLRLGFSVAIHMDFDILLTDEIISVGDVSFQKKCFDKIEEFKKQGKTLVIATQSLDLIDRLCEEAFLLENGEIVQQGHPQKVAARYLELLQEKKLSETFQRRFGKLKWWADKSFWEKKEGSKEAKIVDVKTYNSFGQATNKFKAGETVKIKAQFIVDKEISEPHFGVAIFREDGVYCYGPNTNFDDCKVDKLNKGNGFFSIEFRSLILSPGRYRFSIAIWDKNELWAYDYHVGFYKFKIVGKNNNSQLLNLECKCNSESWWGKLFQPLTLDNPDTLFNSNIRQQKEESSCSNNDFLIELLDPAGDLKDNFNTGEDFKIRLQFKFLKEPQDYYLWVGIFRNDDIYCHGVIRKIRKEEIYLSYPKFPLLTGEYYISIGIWEKNIKEPLFYKHKASFFRMSFLGQDHGTVYLEHYWKWQLP